MWSLINVEEGGWWVVLTVLLVEERPSVEGGGEGADGAEGRHDHHLTHRGTEMSYPHLLALS